MTQVDLILNGRSQGQVANLLNQQGNLNPYAMRPFIDEETGNPCITVFTGGDPKKAENYRTQFVANAVLRRDEWKALDSAVMDISRTRLNGIQDLIDNGLIYNLGNGMGTTVLEWHDISDALEAEMTMDGITRGNNDRVEYQHNYLPIPIIHSDYEINARVMAASRNMGNSLDTTMAETATRKILEKLENMLFTNTTYAWGTKDSRTRNAIYSYINFPDRNTVTLSSNWDASGKTGAQIIDDVRAMKQAAINAKHYGPYMIYIPTAYETVLDDDYDSVTPGTTIRERIMKIDKIKGIKVVDTLPANNVLMVQMTKDVVRLVKGMDIQNVQWKEEGNFVNKFKVMTIQVPQIRSDADGNCGVVHLAS